MAIVDLGTISKVNTMALVDSVLVEIGGALKRIEMSDIRDVINANGENILRQIAWGVPIKQAIQSSTYYGVEGNLAAWKEYKSLSGRYLVDNNGNASKLSPVNSSLFIDGTPVDESKGNVMFISPRLYYLVRNDNVTGIPYLWMSMTPIGGNFIGGAGEGRFNCIGAYKGSISAGALKSVSGVSPVGSKTITEFWNTAQVNGKDWGLTDYTHRQLMVMLGLSEYGDTNIQAKLGYGVCGSVTASLSTQANTLLTGATSIIGDTFGKIDISLVGGTNCSRINISGIEDPYGWRFEMCQGIYCGSSANAGQTGTEVFIYDGNRLPTTTELQTQPNGKFRKIARILSSDYIREIIAGDYFDIIPSKIGGGSTSYWADYYSLTSTGQLVYFGSSCDFGTYSGVSTIACSQPWNATNINSRIAYYGSLTFVSSSHFK